MDIFITEFGKHLYSSLCMPFTFQNAMHFVRESKNCFWICRLVVIILPNTFFHMVTLIIVSFIPRLVVFSYSAATRQGVTLGTERQHYGSSVWSNGSCGLRVLVPKIAMLTLLLPNWSGSRLSRVPGLLFIPAFGCSRNSRENQFSLLLFWECCPSSVEN